jgi:Domain of unknown function (DUF5615)
MLKLASDADVHGPTVDSIQEKGIDLVQVVDALPEGTDDPDLLEWAAAEGRIMLTNDRSTMIGFANQRIANGNPMPGLVVMPPHHWSVRETIWQVELIANVCSPEELRDRVVYLPLKPGDLRPPTRPTTLAPPPPVEEGE